MKTQLENPRPASPIVDRSESVQGWSNPCVAPPMGRGKAVVTLSHAMSPTCWWSWGYYGTLARVRLTYGTQVDLNLAVFPVYQDLEHYFHQYGDSKRVEAWAKDSEMKMGVSIFTAYSKRKFPPTTLPPVLATLAAYRQGQPQGDRFCRALARRFVVEGSDVNTEKEFLDAAKESNLDLVKFRKDLKDEKGLERELQEQNQRLPNVHLGFYNLALTDERGRTVVLDHAYEPDDVLEAIEYLTQGRLKKNVPTDPVEFLRATGPAPTRELARAFGWTVEATEKRLGEAEKARKVRRVALAGSTHWTAA